MIIIETVEINGKEFKHTYSDADFYIQKVGTDKIYASAYDLPSKNFEYIETDKKIRKHEESED